MKTWIAITLSVALYANPEGGKSVSGAVSFHENGSVCEIHASDKAVIEWRNFSIGQGETTRFIQPGASAAVLNRVVGFTPSLINGVLQANGRVILINPSGILIGKEGLIQAADFIGSTAEIVDLSDWSIRTDAGLILPSSPSACINHEGMIHANRAEMVGGQVVLVADCVEASGTTLSPGGEVSLLGNQVCLSGTVDVSGAEGGTVLIGGSFQGGDPLTRTASAVHVHETAVIAADALHKGSGGLIVVWSEDRTQAHGSFSARGGKMGGDGGLIEVSSRGTLDFHAAISTEAPQGTVGMLLLDPTDITISTAATAPFALTPIFNPAANANILDTDLSTLLDTTSVTILTSAGVGGSGDIAFSDGANVTWGGGISPGSLVLTANNNISLLPAALGITLNCTSAQSISMSAGGAITIGSAAATAPVDVLTLGSMSFSAGTGMSVIAGLAGGDALVRNQVNLLPITINIASGNLTMASINSGAQATFGDILGGGGITANIPGGSLLLQADNQGQVFLNSNEFLSIQAGQNITILADDSGAVPQIFVQANSVSGGASFFNAAGGSFLASAGSTGVGGSYEFNLQNTVTTFTTAQDFTLQSTSGILSGFTTLGRDSFLNVGGNFLIDVGGAGSVQILENQSIVANIAGNFTIQANSNATAEFLAGINATVNAGGNISLDKSAGATSFPDAAVAAFNDLTLNAGGSISLGRLSNLLSFSGSILARADANITMAPSSAIDFLAAPSPASSITLIVDNQAPSAPQIGSGSFIMDMGASINASLSGAPVRIFTARQNQNSINGTITGLNFFPGPFGVDTLPFEIWRTYFPSALEGFPFTMFYKEPQDSVVISQALSQEIGEVFDVIEEFAYPPPFYEQYFCMLYCGDEPSKGLIQKGTGWGKKGRSGVLFKRDWQNWIQIDNYRKFHPNRQKFGLPQLETPSPQCPGST